MIPLTHFLVFSAILFSIGVYGLLARRNAILLLISVELMLNAVNVNFMAFSRYITPKAATGQIYTLFAVAIGACEIGVGLAIVLTIYRSRHTLDVDKYNLLKW